MAFPIADRAAGQTRPGACARAFTLVEVVVAIGVVAIGLLGVVAMLRPALGAGRAVALQDGAIRATGAIEGLLGEREFDEVYGWVRDGVSVFAFTLREGSLRSAALPADEGDALRAAVGEDGAAAALDGPLYLAELRLSAENSEPLAALQADFGDPVAYPHAAVFLEVRLHEAVPGVGFEAQAPQPTRLVYRYQLARRR